MKLLSAFFSRRVQDQIFPHRQQFSRVTCVVVSAIDGAMAESEESLTPEQEEEEKKFNGMVDKVFTRLDADGTGRVNAHEIKQFFKLENREQSLERRKTAKQLLKCVVIARMAFLWSRCELTDQRRPCSVPT